VAGMPAPGTWLQARSCAAA